MLRYIKESSDRSSIAVVIPRAVLSNLAALGTLYVALSPRISTQLYGAMLFHPDPYPAGDYDVEELEGVGRKEVLFPSLTGKRLHGWLFRQPEPARVVLFNHGNAGNLTYRLGVLRLLLKAGLSIFIYDYQGYGLSEGRPSLSGICDDALAAYEFLVSAEEFRPQDIIIYGESLGAGVACQLAAARPAAGLILQSAFCSLLHIGKHVMPLVRIYPSWLGPRPCMDNLGYLKGDHPPLLLFHGKLDTLVPFAHAEQLYALARQPKMFVPLPGTGHNDVSATEPERYLQGIRAFIGSLT